jgi:hypothetical protein
MTKFWKAMIIQSSMISKPRQVKSDRKGIIEDNRYRKRRKETHRCNRS